QAFPGRIRAGLCLRHAPRRHLPARLSRDKGDPLEAMNHFSFPILSTLIFLPLLGALLLLFVNRSHERFIKGFTLAFTLAEFALSLPLFFSFDEGAKGMQFVEKAPWFPEWGMSYFLGIDGISLLLVLLTT